MKKYAFKLIATFSFVAMMALGTDVLASPPGGGGGPGGQRWLHSSCPCVPIDGGISLLVAAGVALGGKKDIRFCEKLIRLLPEWISKQLVKNKLVRFILTSFFLFVSWFFLYDYLAAPSQDLRIRLS